MTENISENSNIIASCEKNSSDISLDNSSKLKKNELLFETKKEMIKIKAKRIKKKCAIVKKNSALGKNDSKSEILSSVETHSGTPTNSESDTSNSLGSKKRRNRLGKQKKPPSDKSSRLPKHDEGKPTNTNLATDTNKTIKIRKRGSRGGKQKESRSKRNPLLIDISSQKLRLNCETLFILNLLYVDSKDRENLLIDLAVAKNILVFDKKDKSYILHKDIERLIPHVLLIGNTKLREFNQETIETVENLKSGTVNLKKMIAKSETRNVVKVQKSKYFEDFVNEIVLEGIPDDKKAGFTFTYSKKGERSKTDNYYNNPDFISELEAYIKKCVDENLGTIIEGELRINEKNNYQSFMKNVDGRRDAFIPSRLARKFALEGDIVQAFARNVEYSTLTANPLLNITPDTDDANNEDEFNGTVIGQQEIDLDIISENVSQKNVVAFVIKVVKNVHNRRCVGSFMSSHAKLNYVTFVPRDLKMQTIRIYRQTMPPEITNLSNLESIGETLYEAEIDRFINDLCVGKIVNTIGKCGELDSENKAILLQNDIHLEPYDEEFSESFRTPLIITENDLKEREDIRKQCVFTIDPFTARDLDDAMSCRKLSENTYEIGVHISDVSHFIPENSQLDNIIKQRTTSIYMVNEVFHMIPKPLCYKCSLLPGEDKFTFSVFWTITIDGEVLSTRFTRTIMSSCVQLAYEHAQKVIDNPTQTFDESDFPQIVNEFNVVDIVSTIQILNEIATNLRMKRFNNGALRMDRIKLYFDLNSENGQPNNFYPASLDTANFLIEEFMLLANQSTAQFIYDKYPQIAILRNHQPPLPNLIKKLKEELLNLNVNLDITSSKSIFTGMEKICRESKNPDLMKVCLSNLISKTMSRARYFCAEEVNGPDSLLHYALSIPIYTHFTSPIRRYPDILVHRILSAALDYTDLPKRSIIELHEICSVCNEMKYKAKIAGEQSADLYFLHYVKAKVQVVVPAAILFIGRSVMNVISITTGHQFKISYNNTNSKTFKCVSDISKTPFVVYLINNVDQSKIPLNVFSEIEIALQVSKQKLTATIVNPFGTNGDKVKRTRRSERANKSKNKEDKSKKNEENQNI